MKIKTILFFCFFLLVQTITLAQRADTISTILLKKHSPNKAATFSAIIPGLGQVYNKQYLKVPIIYAGGIALIYAIQWNHKQYQRYLKAYKLESDTSAITKSEFNGLYSSDNLIVLKDYYRRNRDFSAIGLVALYAANIIDAYVYGHFYNFDVSDNLSLHVNPYILPIHNQFSVKPFAGVSLTLNFKK